LSESTDRETEDTLAEAAVREPRSEPPLDAAGPLFPAEPVDPDPPSYAPIVTGLGIAIMAWGFLTNVVILLFGFAFFSLAISIWIKELTS